MNGFVFLTISLIHAKIVPTFDQIAAVARTNRPNAFIQNYCLEDADSTER
ncbi:hypothetical protein [Salipaludibacillus neizhouensis]|nr:hypothetical protein [Salipaludibacillus neizhouensis]